MDFTKIYRTCKKSQALRKGLISVESCLAREEFICVSVTEVKVGTFWPIHGYKVTTLDGTAFFPKDINEVPRNHGLTWYREAFSSADIVLPPYYGMGFLGDHALLINASELHEDKIALGDSMLMEMYSPGDLAALIVGVWSKRKTFDQFHNQLVESTKAYCLGLYGVAIVGLLPCIEGILRRLGVLAGIKVESSVSIRTLVKVFQKLQQREVERTLDGYDWYPAAEINVALLDHIDERVQMFGSISNYLNSKLYLHTDSAPEYLTLNRHGIAHGFFHGYATAGNYLRLFNLLSALSFAAILVEGKGSMLHPGSCEESEVLAASFLKCMTIEKLVA